MTSWTKSSECWLSQGTGTQDPVPWPWQQGYPGQVCSGHEVRLWWRPGKFRVFEPPYGFKRSLPTPEMPPCDKRWTQQEPNRPHASMVPLGFLRDRLPGLQRGSNRQWTWLGSGNGGRPRGRRPVVIQVYQMVKNVSSRPFGVGEMLLERDGSVIPDQAGKVCRWAEHFKELPNQAAQSIYS